MNWLNFAKDTLMTDVITVLFLVYMLGYGFTFAQVYNSKGGVLALMFFLTICLFWPFFIFRGFSDDK